MKGSSNSSNKSSSAGAKQQQGVKFTKRTSSGRTMSLSRDDDNDMSGDNSGSNDYINYTVMMPPTPDNQPGASDSKVDGAATGTSRFAAESQQERHGLNSGNSKSMLLRSQTQDFDHNRWLFETKGTYGIGNAFWQEDQNTFEEGVSMADFMDKPWKPLTRKIRIPGAILSPYRYTSIIYIYIPFFIIPADCVFTCFSFFRLPQEHVVLLRYSRHA